MLYMYLHVYISCLFSAHFEHIQPLTEPRRPLPDINQGGQLTLLTLCMSQFTQVFLLLRQTSYILV